MKRFFKVISVFFVSSVVMALAVGATWTQQTSGVTSTLRGASAASDTVAWVSGSGATVLRTEDGGATWVKVTLPADASGFDFRDIDAVDARTAYILSTPRERPMPRLGSRIYKTSDAGATWTLQYHDEAPGAFLDAMTFWDVDHGIVIGDSIDNKFQILLTDNGGKTWAKVPDPALPPALDNEGAFAGSGTNIAVFGTDHAWIGTGAGPKSRMLHTADRGKRWTVVDTPIVANASTGIFSVAFRDAMHGVAIGGDYRKEKEGVDNAAITSDGGKTWTLVKVSGFRSVVRYIPGATTSLIAVGPQGADMSTDDGKTWTPVEIPVPMAGWHTLSFAPSGTVGFAAGGRGAVARLDVK